MNETYVKNHTNTFEIKGENIEIVNCNNNLNTFVQAV